MDALDLSDEYDRYAREQRKLNRKEHSSSNREKQRRKVAQAKRVIKRKVRDYQHKLTTWLVTEYDVVAVEDLDVKLKPEGMIKECAVCGVETAKSIWVREHSCPACGHTEDRDLNAAKNILSRGLKQLGAGRSESTPVQTALATLTPHREDVSAKRVVEAGSPRA